MDSLFNVLYNYRRILWYPACGWDLRVSHHPITNNVFIHPDLIVANDLNNWDGELIENLMNINGLTIEHEEEIPIPSRPNGLAIFRSIVLQKGALVLRKSLLHLWGIETEDLYQFLSHSRINVNTIFSNRMRGISTLNTNMNTAMANLNTQYYISDLEYHPYHGTYQDAQGYARTNQLLLRGHYSYGVIGNYNDNPPGYVYVFERNIGN
jgi:hypothetical protein